MTKWSQTFGIELPSEYDNSDPWKVTERLFAGYNEGPTSESGGISTISAPWVKVK
jgi:hypothetical protein